MKVWRRDSGRFQRTVSHCGHRRRRLRGSQDPEAGRCQCPQRLVETEDRWHVSEVEKRARTLGNIINSAGFVVVVGVALMMTLSELGLNITPIITGAGIVGLAVGFGAQNRPGSDSLEGLCAEDFICQDRSGADFENCNKPNFRTA